MQNHYYCPRRQLFEIKACSTSMTQAAYWWFYWKLDSFFFFWKQWEYVQLFKITTSASSAVCISRKSAFVRTFESAHSTKFKLTNSSGIVTLNIGFSVKKNNNSQWLPQGDMISQSVPQVGITPLSSCCQAEPCGQWEIITTMASTIDK